MIQKQKIALVEFDNTRIVKIDNENYIDWEDLADLIEDESITTGTIIYNHITEVKDIRKFEKRITYLFFNSRLHLIHTERTQAFEKAKGHHYQVWEVTDKPYSF